MTHKVSVNCYGMGVSLKMSAALALNHVPRSAQVEEIGVATSVVFGLPSGGISGWLSASVVCTSPSRNL